MISVSETLETLYIEPQREAKRIEEARQKKMMEQPRPDWDSWFMTLCFVIAQRSLDKDTKHGCVVTDSSHSILSVGYNSPPRGCDDQNVPLERPAKYDYMKHSEENAIVNAARAGIRLDGSTFYITGPPCHHCFGDMINVGARRIVHGPTPSHMLDENSAKVKQFLLKKLQIEVVELDITSQVINLLSRTIGYVEAKNGSGQ